MLTVGSCFSGIGGLELGLEWTGGFETKWQIEIDPYATKVLEKHWPNVKRYSDITKVRGDELERVDVICGGFPCQDVSVAGKRAGLEGKRTTLWSELFRLVCEVKPRWFVGENVPGLLSANDGRFFGNILRDLASAGYDAEWGVLSAAGVGAPHLRRRVFILAHPNGDGLETDTNEDFLRHEAVDALSIRHVGAMGGSGKWLEPRPIGARPMGVDNGIPVDVDRLRCLGNAVVPQVAQKIGEMILKSTHHGE